MTVNNVKSCCLPQEAPSQATLHAGSACGDEMATQTHNDLLLPTSRTAICVERSCSELHSALIPSLPSSLPRQ